MMLEGEEGYNSYIDINLAITHLCFLIIIQLNLDQNEQRHRTSFLKDTWWDVAFLLHDNTANPTDVL
jgi:hypothetical protein